MQSLDFFVLWFVVKNGFKIRQVVDFECTASLAGCKIVLGGIGKVYLDMYFLKSVLN